MKFSTLLFLFSITYTLAFCQESNLKSSYTIPDSIKGIAFYAELKINEPFSNKRKSPGIYVNGISLVLGYKKNEKAFKFSYFAKPGQYIVYGNGTDTGGHAISWKYNWKESETYPLLIATASDSATHKTLYSGYIFLPTEQKWKLIGTRSYNDTAALKYLRSSAPKNANAVFTNRWLQRSNGTWKALDSQTTRPPSLRQMSNIDSLLQQQIEEELLRTRLKDSAVYKEGMFYQVLKEGSGRLVKVTDTLAVHYKGSLFSDGSVFDQTTDKPASFPLERLIKGWQLGLLHCKVGGKMRLYLPSGSAYGIRTRSAEIPPNSILVFDVEVLDAKEKTTK